MLSSSLAVASSPVEEQLAMSPAPTSRAGGSAVTCPVGVIHVLPGENGLWSSVHVVSSSSAARAGTLARRPRRDRGFIRKGLWRRGVKAIGSDHSCGQVLCQGVALPQQTETHLRACFCWNRTGQGGGGGCGPATTLLNPGWASRGDACLAARQGVRTLSGSYRCPSR